MSVKLLTEHNLELLCLKRGCTGSSESTLVQKPHCWKSHVAAHIMLLQHCPLISRLASNFLIVILFPICQQIWPPLAMLTLGVDPRMFASK